MSMERRVSILRSVLVIVGLAFAVGLPILVNVFPSGFMWEPRQPEYEQMIGVILVTLGVFVLRASRDPLQHLSLIWFTCWSSLLHGALMAAQAFVDPVEKANFVGDVPFMLGVGVLLAVVTPRGAELRSQTPPHPTLEGGMP